METIELRTVDGDKVDVEITEMTRAIINNTALLYGMDHQAILELRKAYRKRRGPMPITKESVAEVFGD